MKKKRVSSLCVFFLTVLMGCVQEKNVKQIVADKEDLEQEIVRVDTAFAVADEVWEDDVVEECDIDSLRNILIEVMAGNYMTQREDSLLRSKEKRYIEKIMQIPGVDDYAYSESFDGFEALQEVEMAVFQRYMQKHYPNVFNSDAVKNGLSSFYGIDWDAVGDNEEIVQFANFSIMFSPDWLDDKSTDEQKLMCYESATSFSLKYCVVLCGIEDRFISFEKTDTVDLGYIEMWLPDTESDIVFDKAKMERLVHRNLYIVNRNKCSRNWLLLNDIKFLERALVHYGYDKDYYVNRKIINYRLGPYLGKNSVEDELDLYYYSYHLFVNYLWKINENLLKMVAEETQKEIEHYEKDHRLSMNTKLFDILSNCVLHSDRNDMRNAEFFCRFALMEIGLNKQFCRYNRNGYFNIEGCSTSYYLFEKEIMDEAKKNNYFGLEGFGDVLRVLNWDAKHDPQGSNEYVPFDYTTL